MDIEADIQRLNRKISYYYVLDSYPETSLDQDFIFIRFFSKPERGVIRDFLRGPTLRGSRHTYMNVTPVKEPFEATLRLIQELA